MGTHNTCIKDNRIIWVREIQKNMPDWYVRIKILVNNL